MSHDTNITHRCKCVVYANRGRERECIATLRLRFGQWEFGLGLREVKATFQGVAVAWAHDATDYKGRGYPRREGVKIEWCVGPGIGIGAISLWRDGTTTSLV